MKRLASLSVDLDEIHHYLAIHGLSGGAGQGREHAVYDLGLPRFAEFAREHRVPLTLFAVGADLSRADNARQLAGLAREGHEVSNHSLDHRYDLTRLDRHSMRRQVLEGGRAIEGAVGRRPPGFRAPGYLMTDELAEVVREAGASYDSSVFPCPTYYLAKAAVLFGQRLRGRTSSSLLDAPRVLGAPTAPYRLGRPYTRAGTGLVELPIQVTPWLRLPYIGTTLTLGGPRLARWLTRSIQRLPFINLELHGIDLLEVTDGLEALAPHQADLRVPLATKRRVLGGVVRQLEQAGYRFVRLEDAARELAALL